MKFTRQEVIDSALMLQGTFDYRLERLGRTFCDKVVKFSDEYKACTSIEDKIEVYSRIFEYLTEQKPNQALGAQLLFTIDGAKFRSDEIPQYAEFVSKYNSLVVAATDIDINRVTDIDYVNTLPEYYEFN